MKAVKCTKYGKPEVLKIAQFPKPAAKEDEVLIKIHASAVTMSDIYIRSSKVGFPTVLFLRLAMGILKPRRPIIGIVFSGTVEKCGEKITRFKEGDEVYGLTGFKLGTYAEYTCMKEIDSTNGCIAHRPLNISHEEATSVAYGSLLAIQFLKAGGIDPFLPQRSLSGKRVLIYGASGTTGTIAVQLCTCLGAEVTAVCSSKNHDLVRTLGANTLFDYQKQNTLDEDDLYDLVFDAVGKSKKSALRTSCEKALLPGGKLSSIDDKALLLDSKNLDLITRLVESGSIKPILDKIYALDEIVEAHRYVEQGHKVGGVAVHVQD